MKKTITFFGCKAKIVREPPPNAFSIPLLNGLYYVEESSTTEVPVSLQFKIINRSNRDIINAHLDFLGLRNYTRQEIRKVFSKWMIEKVGSDDDKNAIYRLWIGRLKKKQSVDIEITFLVKPKPKVSKIAYERRIDLVALKAKTLEDLIEKLDCGDFASVLWTSAAWIRRSISYERVYFRLSPKNIVMRGRGSCLSVSDILGYILRRCGYLPYIVKGLYMNEMHAWVTLVLNGDLVPVDILAGMIGGIGSLWVEHFWEKTKKDFVVSKPKNVTISKRRLFIALDQWERLRY